MDVKKKDRVYITKFLFPEERRITEPADMLRMAASAEAICRLKYCEGEQVQDICLQVHKDRTLISSIYSSDSFRYELKDPGEVKRACFYLFNCFDPSEPCGEETAALQMSRSKYEELREKARTCSLYFLAESLTSQTGDLDQSAQLAKVMKSATADGELRLCSLNEDKWIYQHAGYIEDGSSGWLLRMSSEAAEDWMIAVPVTKSQICSALYEWVMQSLSSAISE